MKKKPHERTIRSKRQLKRTLLKLLQERAYESLTVQQIAAHAGVGRSTFYSHYSSKDELLFDGFDHYLLEIGSNVHCQSAESNWLIRSSREKLNPLGSNLATPALPFSLPLFRHVRSQRKFFLDTFVGNLNQPIRTKTNGMLVDMLLKCYAGSHGTRDKVAMEGNAQAIVGAFLSIATWWLESAPEKSAMYVDCVFSNAIRRL